uniref:Lectin-B n=1 Tax=Anthurium amnicola TaxID=1678845 RepID=A0A1D1YM56_9ARAE
MRSAILSLLLFLSSASFSAANYVVSNPGTGVTWNGDDNVKIEWTGTDEKFVDVRLVHGPAANLQLYAVICADVPSSAGKCNYKVDGNIPSGRDFAITVGKSPNLYGYSSFFSIKAKGPLPDSTGCPNFGGQNCPESLPCCSAAGYCGSSDAHCGAGCMTKYSFNGKCGSNQSPPPPPPPSPSNGQQKCGDVMCTSANPCCSKFNYCGATTGHCGTGCQAGMSFNGKCLATQAPFKPKKCGSKYCKSSAPCCSKTNKCGSSNTACGAGCQPKKSFAGKCTK